MPGDDYSRRAERRGARSSELTQAVICPSHPAGAAAARVPHGSLAAANLPHRSASMQTTDLRIALFTGNYNYVRDGRSEEHTSELQSLMRISYAVFCLKKKTSKLPQTHHHK